MLTHIHADYIAGHLELSRKTGAKIVCGPTAKAHFKFHEAKDGEIFKLGKVTFKWLHTPGHTMESSSMLLKDHNKKKVGIFTGDTLFIGDVGRPDLAVTTTVTKEDLAAKIYDSIHSKILPLPDDVIIWPNHGAGSACGKSLGVKRFDTLGNQKKENQYLHPMKRKKFVKMLCKGIPSPP